MTKNMIQKSDGEIGKFSYWDMECTRRTRPLSPNLRGQGYAIHKCKVLCPHISAIDKGKLGGE